MDSSTFNAAKPRKLEDKNQYNHLFMQILMHGSNI